MKYLQYDRICSGAYKDFSGDLLFYFFGDKFISFGMTEMVMVMGI